MDSRFFDEADISVEKSFDSVFSEEKVDDFFYKAFKKDHSGKSMEATIEDELNDLSLYREMNNFTKINNILRISGEKDYQERMVGISSRYYNKALVKIKEQIARYADLKNNVTHYLPPSNSASKAERKNYERDVQELAQEVEEQIQFTEDMRSVYANNIIKFAMIDAEVIAKVVGHSRTTLKDLDSYKQILKHYEELKTVDIETAFKQENIDSSLTILARMNESMLNFKYDMAEMWHNPDLRENIKLVKSDIAHYQKDKIREYSANVQNQYGVLSQKYSNDKKVDILFENSLVLNRINKKLGTPVYDFNNFTYRTAMFLDGLTLNDKTLTQIKRTFKAPGLIKRANDLYKIAQSDPNFEMPQNYFRNGILIDQYLERAIAANKIVSYKSKNFATNYGIKDGILASYKKTVQLFKADADPVAEEVNEILMGELMVGKARRLHVVCESLGQMVNEATENMSEERRSVYIKNVLGLMAGYKNAIQDSIKDVYSHTSGLNLTQEEDYAKIMGQVQEIFEGRGEESFLTSAQRYSAGISLCDKLIYNMTEEQLKVFYDKLGTKLTDIDKVMANFDDFQEQKDCTVAINLALRDGIRPFAIESKNTFFNKDLKEQLLSTFEYQDNRLIADHGKERVRNFFNNWDSVDIKDRVSSRIYREYLKTPDFLLPYKQKAIAIGPESEQEDSSQNIALQAQEPSIEQENKPERSEDEQSAQQDQKDEKQPEKFSLDIKPDLDKLDEIRGKYAVKNDGKMDDDIKRVLYGLCANIFAMLALVLLGGMLFSGAFFGAAAVPAVFSVPGVLTAGIACGYCALKHYEFKQARQGDAKEAKAIADKYGLKFNKNAFLLSPLDYTRKMKKRIKKQAAKASLFYDFKSATMSQIESNLPKKNKKKKNEKDNANEHSNEQGASEEKDNGIQQQSDDVVQEQQVNDGSDGGNDTANENQEPEKETEVEILEPEQSISSSQDQDAPEIVIEDESQHASNNSKDNKDKQEEKEQNAENANNDQKSTKVQEAEAEKLRKEQEEQAKKEQEEKAAEQALKEQELQQQKEAEEKKRAEAQMNNDPSRSQTFKTEFSQSMDDDGGRKRKKQ